MVGALKLKSKNIEIRFPINFEKNNLLICGGLIVGGIILFFWERNRE